MKPRPTSIRFLSAALPVVIVGLGWSALSAVLYAAGHVPSGPVFAAPRASYYAAQAGFAVPVILLQFWILLAVTGRVLGGLDADSLDAHRRAMALAFAVPLGLTWLLPDICAYAIAGFEALARVVRVAAPVTAALTFALVLRVLKRSFAASWGRVAVAALLGGIAQGFVGGLLLR